MAWISDCGSNRKYPIARLTIQETYSYLYPPKFMRAWITDAASDANRRVPLSFKAHCSMCGALGICMNLNKADDESMDQLKSYVQQYKEIRNIVQFGRLARLKSCMKDEMYFGKKGGCLLNESAVNLV